MFLQKSKGPVTTLGPLLFMSIVCCGAILSSSCSSFQQQSARWQWQRDSSFVPEGVFKGAIDFEIIATQGLPQLVSYNGSHLQFFDVEAFQLQGVHEDSTFAGNRIQCKDGLQSALLSDQAILLYSNSQAIQILEHKKLPDGVRISPIPSFLFDWEENRALVQIFDFRNKVGRAHPKDYPFLALWDGTNLTILPKFPLPQFVGNNEWVEPSFFFDQNASQYLVSCSHVPLIFTINKQTLQVDSLQLGETFSTDDFHAADDKSAMGLFANRQRNLKDGPSYGPALFVQSDNGETVIARPFFMKRTHPSDSVTFNPVQLLWLDSQGFQGSKLIINQAVGFDHQRWFSAGGTIYTRLGYKARNKNAQAMWYLFSFSLAQEVD